MNLNKLILLSLFILTTVSCDEQKPIIQNIEVTKKDNWKDVLEDQIKLLGHRNWIVVVDKAYPLQSNTGITTLLSDTGQLETLKYVADVIDRQQHIKPIIYVDKEIDFIEESAAPGISKYRESLRNLLEKESFNKIIHEDIITMLDKAADQFKIIIIKTDFTIPYTSVFFQLDCKYWNTESELLLRKKIINSKE
ncbi:hypothetical protein NBT05_15210 [Aquimarina sp. ERC-38]|uniref:RbsD/FucU domain-containing protein n=1 Tax=Aquimarina sp. ERC-38 TaxID=2949996 RepID=UPI0022467DA6|nr:RbsD/FucU domain-containing protein [Aquimarina sp. ERC-38]UZO80291.1 hypothetical protein NBT05_15210 [Aquimarina sp. ERC-38]